MKKRILPRSFYLNEDVLTMSQALLGKFLVTRIGHQLTSGMIVEAEAYNGVDDRASHAFNDRRTARTETMYQKGGVAYIYLCYGIHHLFNAVTAEADVPHAVLIRAVEPIDGIEIMLQRRRMHKINYKLTSGPGMFTQALGITTEFNGHLLTQAPIWIEERGVVISKKDIVATPRIGIDYAKEHKDLPWRFCLRNSPWVSKA
ncbi:MAG: DNA-3-methyladenine glycosylase [Candidatus Berkiellales bacterium]